MQIILQEIDYQRMASKQEMDHQNMTSKQELESELFTQSVLLIKRGFNYPID